MNGKIEKAIARVVEHGQFILGPEVGSLEEQLAQFSGCRYAVMCANGTDALLLVLMAWGVGPGDAVFVPSYTFAATAEVVALAGATPVFVDIDPSDYTMDRASLAKAVPYAVELGLRPAVVVPVDLFGHPANYPLLEEVSRRHGLRIVADGAQSFGASADGRRVGSLTEATTTSFFPSKPLGCYGDGGAIFTNDARLASTLKSLRMHGNELGRYVRIGMNSRLDTLQAAVLLEKLGILSEEIRSRQRIADFYANTLADVAVVPAVRAGVESAWGQYTIQVEERDAVRDHLQRRAISSAVYYPEPLHVQPAYALFPFSPDGLSNTSQLSAQALSLPIHPYLSEPDQQRVVREVRQAITTGAKL
ncbi:MAG: DegT/DnrJ/EryC1/StrS family aminotransferase [Actinomycetota bacterium]|nr:DegT/DnrJ/EryC1/StrS family aminotransferase [Actinomycetota bacterium]